MDAVILYVDGDDPLWQKEYRETLGMPVQANRYRDWGTLKYLFRGIEKYLPWVEKVHLVVSGESQIPGWLNYDEVNVVCHRDIIPGAYLPTFNSCGIEVHIPYIQGLAEEFIYFNDDMFPINPCSPELFFKDGRPQELLRERSIQSPPQNVYRYQCLKSMNVARAAAGKPEGEMYLFPAHWPHPMLKSSCLEVLKSQSWRIAEQMTPIRSNKNVNQYLFLDYMYLKGKTDIVHVPFVYVTPKKQTPEEVHQTILENEKAVLCINDNGCRDEDYPEYKEAVLSAFQAKFPEKSRFEKLPGERKGRLIVSMTSYPARIGGAADIWKSVLRQKTDEPFRCVMVLSEEEFPNHRLPDDLQRLVKDGWIELLWWPRNTRSHMKLYPVMQTWPDADVITIDDDMYKPQGWLQNMIEDHRRWPQDVISNSFTYNLDSNMGWHRMLDLPQKVSKGKNDVPGLVFQFARICSGHGTLFPAHTFTDERFFDEKAMMRLAPTCDETWMWMWAMLSGREFRQSSWIYDESALTVPGTQKMPTALYKANRLIYDKMYEDLFREYPQFKEELQKRQRRYVVAAAEERGKYPYDAVATTDDPRKIEQLLKQYQDRPNRIAEFEGEKLYPPGI